MVWTLESVGRAKGVDRHRDEEEVRQVRFGRWRDARSDLARRHGPMKEAWSAHLARQPPEVVAILAPVAAARTAVGAVTAMRSLHNSLTCLRCTPIALASAPCVKPIGSDHEESAQPLVPETDNH